MSLLKFGVVLLVYLPLYAMKKGQEIGGAGPSNGRHRGLSITVPEIQEGQVAAQTPALATSRLSPNTQRNLLELSARGINTIDAKFYERIVRGGQLAKHILDNRIQEFTDANSYLNAIIDLMWFFYGEAVSKNQAFNEGTFVIEDTDFKFYNFLMTYVKMRNKSVKDDPVEDKTSMTNVEVVGEFFGKFVSGQESPLAYPRLSSHLESTQYGHPVAEGLGCKGRYRHYGIDIRWSDGGDHTMTRLPSKNKSHILFGKMGANLLFIKLEEAGTGELSHAAGFLSSIGTKAMMKVRSAISTPKFSPGTPVSSPMSTSGIGDDDPSYRKERVPQAFMTLIDQVSKNFSLNEENKETFKKLIATFGIRGLYLLVNDFENLTILLNDVGVCEIKSPLTMGRVQGLESTIKKDQRLQEHLAAVLADVKKNYDHLELRTGREVILTQKELAVASAFYGGSSERVCSIAESSQQGQEKVVKKTNEIFGRRVIVYNDSNNRLELTVQNRNQKWEAVLVPGARVDLGSQKDFCDAYRINYKTYGGGWGLGAKSYILDLALPIRGSSSQDIGQDQVHAVHVSVSEKSSRLKQLQPYEHSLIIERAQVNSLPSDNDPYKVFPGVVYWSSHGGLAWNMFQKTSIEQLLKSQKDFPRYVLGLPQNFGKVGLERSYKRLMQEWNLDLYPDNKLLVEKIRKIIEDSYQVLSR